MLGHHHEATQGGAVQGLPVAQYVALRYLIEVADELAGLVVDRVIAFFEGIQFFKDLYRDGHIMLFKALNG